MQSVDLGAGFVASALASGDDHVCALSSAGMVKCWGDNRLGQLGLGDTKSRGAQASEMGDALAPVDLGRGQVVLSITAGAHHTCARFVENTMKCWGDNSRGQLGLGDTILHGSDASQMGDNLGFVMLLPGESVLTIEAKANRTCARTESGTRCWGANRAGELGFGQVGDMGGTPGSIPRLLPVLGI